MTQDGSVYIADIGNHKIRKIDPAGIITTFAGTGTPGSTGDGGPATSAQLHTPLEVEVGPDGNVYIIDGGTHSIRRVDASGIITKFAGTGLATYGGDDGPATSASLNNPRDVSVGPDGSVYIADRQNHRSAKFPPTG